ERPPGVDRLDLGDDVELAASVALDGDVAHRLEPGAEPARRLSGPPGDPPPPAPAPGGGAGRGGGPPPVCRAAGGRLSPGEAHGPALVAVQGHGPQSSYRRVIRRGGGPAVLSRRRRRSGARGAGTPGSPRTGGRAGSPATGRR